MAKKRKDPNAPKKNRNAYSFFFEITRPEIVKEDPDTPFGQIGKIAGERWRALDDSEKKTYQKMAADDKKRYEREMRSYTPPDDADTGSRKKKK
mmetsp:Transcript_2785/g.4095  ORF Transcript_2785/g.4095 Transcript_2785/m.4095 type:complete len:94 (-) Transcript_2785:113-394(-)|eukprot:CAMPEP_0113944506 /NCGR_PEP_ID=MMETSP1339-20121228/34466_1 /TAXON_ID=94617 /ORGANISM="Fibrocapsa japonica" /LENGTH=93 /DNA_ID=CAMNT_0000949731 /DNA_START=108 /DNA_END=389 /DNA_ORIENTATION=- /assembly_acc=CAM_ASM_000762